MTARGDGVQRMTGFGVAGRRREAVSPKDKPWRAEVGRTVITGVLSDLNSGVIEVEPIGARAVRHSSLQLKSSRDSCLLRYEFEMEYIALTGILSSRLPGLSSTEATWFSPKASHLLFCL